MQLWLFTTCTEITCKCSLYARCLHGTRQEIKVKTVYRAVTAYFQQEMCQGPQSQGRKRSETCKQCNTLTRSMVRQSIAPEHYSRSRLPFKEHVYFQHLHRIHKKDMVCSWFVYHLHTCARRAFWPIFASALTVCECAVLGFKLQLPSLPASKRIRAMQSIW